MKKIVLSLALLGALASFSSKAQAQGAAPFWAPQNSIYNPAASLGNGFRLAHVSIALTNPNIVWGIGGELPPPGATSYTFDKWVKSVDGGATWTTGNIQFGTGYTVGMMQAIDANTCFFMNYSNNGGGEVRRTTDGGATWVNMAANGVNFTLPGSFPNVIAFFDANNGFAAGDPQPAATATTPAGPFQIYTTGDGGNTWRRVATSNLPVAGDAEYGLVGSVARVGNTAWMGGTDQGGANAKVYKSVDQGRTWTASNSPFTDVGGIAFSTATNGLIVNGADIAATTNGGTSFAPVAYTGPFYGQFDIAAVPGVAGMYVASGLRDVPTPTANDYGTVITGNNGQRWTQIDSTIIRYDLDIASNTVGYAVGNNTNPPAGQQPGSLRAIYKNSRPFSSILAARNNAANNTVALSVYPNPSSNGVFTLGLPSGTRNAQNIRVFDALGREVFRRQLNATSAVGAVGLPLDLSSLKSGVYTLELTNSEGTGRQKLVIE
ncbi:T9SS type A sorting domain-containing protein [Hymenobacter koreensis]|uniref:Secretion system C-terminal sorting domain-containing protein n=1 Tax=Hymenobacter koreensis TaxID=1084523 RepID=A0ABP8JB03_9BACT